jgi:hypothetical protein
VAVVFLGALGHLAKSGLWYWFFLVDALELVCGEGQRYLCVLDPVVKCEGP